MMEGYVMAAGDDNVLKQEPESPEHVTSSWKHHIDSEEPDILISEDEDDLPAIWNVKSTIGFAHPTELKKEDQPLEKPQTDNGEESKDASMEMPASSSSSASKLKTMLDALLDEKLQKANENRELQEMEAELKEGLRRGGVNRLPVQEELSEDEALTAEQREKLRKLEVLDTVIEDQPPGELVFRPVAYGCLFQYPETLTLAGCGFVPGSSRIDKLLAAVTPESLPDVLGCSLITPCFRSISHPSAVLSWMLQLMSVHPSQLVVQSCHRILTELLQVSVNTWVPSVDQIYTILINYGATLDTLCPDPIYRPVNLETRPEAEADGVGVDAEDGEDGAALDGAALDGAALDGAALDGAALDGAALDGAALDGYPLENLKFVLQLLTEAISVRSTRYSCTDLTALALAVFRASLDEMLTVGILLFDIQMCVAAILAAFSEDVWPEKAAELCRTLSTYTEHHHNKVLLVEVLPPTERGLYLQQRLAYAMLHTMLQERTLLNSHIYTFRLRSLLSILGYLQVRDVSDFYHFSSLLHLINYCVGNETPRASEKGDLQKVRNVIKGLMGEIREYVNILDRSVVKEMMARLSSKLVFMIQNTGSMQRTMFEYTKPQPAVLSVDQPMDCQLEEEASRMDQSQACVKEEVDHQSQAVKQGVGDSTGQPETSIENGVGEVGQSQAGVKDVDHHSHCTTQEDDCKHQSETSTENDATVVHQSKSSTSGDNYTGLVSQSQAGVEEHEHQPQTVSHESKHSMDRHDASATDQTPATDGTISQPTSQEEEADQRVAAEAGPVIDKENLQPMEF